MCRLLLCLVLLSASCCLLGCRALLEFPDGRAAATPSPGAPSDRLPPQGGVVLAPGESPSVLQDLAVLRAELARLKKAGGDPAAVQALEAEVRQKADRSLVDTVFARLTRQEEETAQARPILERAAWWAGWTPWVVSALGFPAAGGALALGLKLGGAAYRGLRPRHSDPTPVELQPTVLSPEQALRDLVGKASAALATVHSLRNLLHPASPPPQPAVSTPTTTPPAT